MSFKSNDPSGGDVFGSGIKECVPSSLNSYELGVSMKVFCHKKTSMERVKTDTVNVCLAAVQCNARTGWNTMTR